MTEESEPQTPVVGIVGEGAADFTVLRLILAGYFQDPDIYLNPLQPLRDATGSFDDGGWHQVLEYCKSEQFRGSFNSNDYVIIQIDTDISESHPSYQIAHRAPTGRLYSCEELAALVYDKLVELIGQDFYNSHKERIIFAVCIHSIECWILPLHWDDSRKERVENCLKCLNEKLLTKEGFTIHSKDIRYYDKAAKGYAKHRTLRQHWQANPSLRIFISALESRFHRGFNP